MLVPRAYNKLKVHLMVYRKIVFIFRYKNEINLTLIQPKIGVWAKVCFAYMVVSCKRNETQTKVTKRNYE